MPNINLISSRRAETLRLRRVMRGLLATMLGTSGIGLAILVALGLQLALAGQALDKAEKDLETLRSVRQEIEAARKAQADLKPKLDTLSQAQQVTTRWYGLLEGLKRAVPRETWLTNLRVERAGEGGQALVLQGLTKNHTNAGITMMLLQKQPEFYKDVVLKYTTAQEIDEQKVVEYQLSAFLNQPEKEKEAEEKAKAKEKKGSKA
jgi:Tfp pilus assembly protein PilN